jgi:hypothetical protein
MFIVIPATNVCTQSLAASRLINPDDRYSGR